MQDLSFLNQELKLPPLQWNPESHHGTAREALNQSFLLRLLDVES